MPSVVLNAGEAKKPVEYRRHFRVLDRDKVAIYEATEIVRMSEEKDENHLLIHDEGHGDFILSKVWTFDSQLSVSRLNDLKNRSFLEASYKHPFSSKTRSATLAEGRANPLLVEAGAVFTLESNGGRWEGLARDEWNDSTRLRQLRHQVRQTLDFSLLEAIERMRGTLFGTDPAAYFYSMVCKFAVYDTSSDDAVPSAGASDDLAPDCEFDKHFGFPCSEKQLARVKKAAADGKVLARY